MMPVLINRGLENITEDIIPLALSAVTYPYVKMQYTFCKGAGREGSLIHQSCRLCECG